MQNKLHPVLYEIVQLMQELKSEMTKVKMGKLSHDELSKAYRSSALGSEQPREVAMTPLMKNAIKHYDRVPDDFRLKTNDPMTKAENAIISNMKQLLLYYNGSKTSFNEDLPLRSVEHYNVQCHQNMKDNLRDIQPGQAEARKKMAEKYTTKTSNTIDDIIRKICNDKAFGKTILIVLNLIPEVRASDDIREINIPFMRKHSGVGYPYYQNDRTINPQTGRTYAEETMRVAERIKDRFDEWYKFNISTMYGRNQRGRGRLLIAVSRILNLLLNSLESVEIEAYKKKSPLFVGYRDDIELKKALVTILEECEQYGLLCANEDYSSYDSTVGEGMLALIGAISIYKANGSRSKKIAKMRTLFGFKTLLVNGLTNQVMEVYGRIFSGYIDTNRGGGLCNAIQMTDVCMLQDKNYSDLTYLLTYYMLVMGDDNLHVYRRNSLDRKQLALDMKKQFGGIINDSKFEFGPTFLQYRVFEDPKTKQLVMVYAWTRVVRSMLMKEESKGLGPVGWTYAWYQQLFKLYEYTEAFSIAVNLLIKFDDNLFFKDTPISELNQMLRKEDEAALSKLNTANQKRRFTGTWDKLSDGDPSKARFGNDDNLLQKIQDKIREVYDPQFYQKHNLVY